MDPVEPAPVHRVGPSHDERGADEPAEQRVPRARRQAAPPGEPVPGHRTRERGAEHRDHIVRTDRDDARDRARHRLAEQQRAEHVADRGEHHRAAGRAARVATSVAIAFAASWTPFVNANASAIAIAATSPVLIGSQCRVARVSTPRRPPEPQ